jgi:hypothetical protein
MSSCKLSLLSAVAVAGLLLPALPAFAAPGGGRGGGGRGGAGAGGRGASSGRGAPVSGGRIAPVSGGRIGPVSAGRVAPGFVQPGVATFRGNYPRSAGVVVGGYGLGS